MTTRRAFIAVLFASVAVSEAAAKSINSKGTRAGAPPPAAPLSDVPGPSGAASFTVNFGAVSNTDGIVLYYDTAANTSIDPADWPYRKVSVGAGLTSVTVTGVAVDDYVCKPTGYSGSTVGDMGQQITKTAA